MSMTDELGRGQGTRATFTLSLFGLLLLAIMSAGFASTQANAVSAARPIRVIHPTFLDTPVNITAAIGSDVLLPCSVQNLGPKSVIWKKITQANPISIGEYVFDPDESYEVIRGESRHNAHHNRHNRWRPSHEDPRWDLLIRAVNFHHAGTYECQISTKEDFGRNVTLKVTDDRIEGSRHHKQKETGIHLSGTLYVEKGSTIDLNCTATSIDYRPKGVDWFKDGSKIKQEPRILFTDYVLTAENVLHSRLQIDQSTMDDAGTYVCRFSARHVQSVKVIVLNTDSSNRRRGTGSEGLKTAKAYPHNNKGDDKSTCSLNKPHMFLVLLLIAAALTRS